MISRNKASRARGFLFIFAAFVAACVVALPQSAWAYNAKADTVEVHDVDDLLDQIAASRIMPYEKNIVLTDDIDFNKFDQEGGKLQYIVEKYGSLTFGNKDNPFKGSFDGNGHYIIGLNYKRDFWKPVANTGLFSFTKDAYIHDIHFKDCYIGADFRGGVLVGHADNTRIESVRMESCTISVTPANNSVSLITNAGVMGGMVVGEMVNGSSLYDCTVQGGRVVNNSVVAVSGLGGEGLYLGALAGSAENSTIEYCRVIPTEQYYLDRVNNPKLSVYDGDHKYLTEVYNRYEVAVGAVSGQGVYAGGVVGYANNVDVVDCFSTAWCHTWVANYVGVGSGNIGYVGGIIAHAKSKDEGGASQVIRCHYASNMESYQWNSLAVIPIIQSNVYLAGLVERDWNEDTVIQNSYFKRNDIVGKDEAIKPYPNGFVRAWGDWLGLNYSGGENGQSAQGFGYGPIVDNEQYANRLFWEDEGYDFEGDELRYSLADNQVEPHINKWIMDDYLGIPVHGASVKATLDFPGAGDVSISASKMGSEQKTSDPYNFAVQGVTANEESLTFTATVNNDKKSDALGMVSSDDNAGFRFMGWFRNKGVDVNHTKKGGHTFFDPLVPPEPNGEQVFNNENDKLNPAYEAKNSGTGDERDTQFADNDLFVAYHQAQVLFHDVKGAVVNKTDSASEEQPNTDDDWYNHQDALPVVAEPVNREGVDEGAKFLGWTTEKNPSESDDGWPNVTVSQLNEMKTHGKFFEDGEPIERPMDLYPVYASLAMNINVIAEGHELDPTNADLNVREGVLKANVTANNGKYSLSVQGFNADGTLMAEGELPDGYRFLGWYEVELDEEGKPVVASVIPNVVIQDWSKWDKGEQNNNMPLKTVSANVYQAGLRLSAEPVYVIPDNVDLTERHCYIARFEYRVDYYAKTPDPEKPTEWSNPYLMASVWEPYLGKFDNIAGPNYYDWKHSHWTLDAIYGCAETDEHLAENKLSAGVAAHTLANGHNKRDGVAGNYGMEIYSDFPNSADFETGHLASGIFFEVYATTRPNFQIEGGTWVRTNERDYSVIGETHEAPHKYTWRLGMMSGNAEYWIEARLAAEVDFMDTRGDAPVKTVTRGYEKYEKYNPDTGTYENNYQPVLMREDKTYTYRYPVRKGFQESATDEKPMSAEPCVDRPEGKPAPFTTTSGASPSDAEMQAKRPGSLFLGWIDKTAIDHGTMTQAEYETIYDEVTRTARVSIEAIKPYLVTEKTLCERPMTLYPVYADFSCDTTTNITRGTALTDPADPAIDPTLDTVKINGDGTKTVNVSADVDEKTSAAYELVSWTIERPEGTVVDTITATDDFGHPVEGDKKGTPVSNTNPRLSYNIIAGAKHVIVANYRAKVDANLSVVYHVRHSSEPDSTVTVERKNGDLLGRAPAAGFEVKDSVLVGWSEQQPADGFDYLMFDKGNPVLMVDELTVVERSMELWPVYRTVTIGDKDDEGVDVRINSNIDGEPGVPAGHRRAVVKTVDTPQGKQSYVALEADVVAGYKFLGWYKDYKDIGVDSVVDGIPVPGNRVMGDEVFAGNLYTAVYQKMQVYSVVYHFPNGNTSTVEIDGDNPTKFIETVKVQKPVLDENGNPTFDQDGNPIMVETEEQAVVVGGEQNAAIEGVLDKVNAKGEYRELFCEWEWKKTDDTTVPWREFCGVDHDGVEGKGIVAHLEEAGMATMNLYPVTHLFNALDQDDKFYPASNLVWQIDPAALAMDVADPDAPDAKPAVRIAFGPRTLYTGNKLTIHMDQVHYAQSNGTEPQKTPVDDKLVALYDNFDLTTATELDRKVTGRETTDPVDNPDPGSAVFHFKTDGALTIEKTAPISAAGSTFTFTVTECNENGDPKPDAKTATVVLTAAAGGDAARATCTLNLPWGYYKVEESTWGWRYSPTYQFFENGMTVEGRSDNVVLIKSNGNVRVTNSLTNNNYLDGEDRTQNVFGEGPKKMQGGAR